MRIRYPVYFTDTYAIYVYITNGNKASQKEGTDFPKVIMGIHCRDEVMDLNTGDQTAARGRL